MSTVWTARLYVNRAGCEPNEREYGCVRPACYMVNVSMAVVASLSMKLGLSVTVIFTLVASVLYIRNYIVTERERQSKQ